MRVIAGRYRGLNLADFLGKDIRPTADRVKESLFNILMSRITGARVLDLFCGSGSLGIECLSRGAGHVCFNDISPASIAVLRRNLAKLKGQESYSVTTLGYGECLKSMRGKFDVIFIDPPYAHETGVRSLELIAEMKLLAEGGVAVYERDRAFFGDVCGLQKTDERRYGKTYLTFFSPCGGGDL